MISVENNLNYYHLTLVHTQHNNTERHENIHRNIQEEIIKLRKLYEEGLRTNEMCIFWQLSIT